MVPHESPRRQGTMGAIERLLFILSFASFRPRNGGNFHLAHKCRRCYF